MVLWGLKTLVSTPITSLNFQQNVRVTQPLTSHGGFGDAKMAVNFGLNQPTSKQLKKQSLFTISEKNTGSVSQ